MFQKAQALLTSWEGEKSPVHGSNKEIIFSNVVNNDGGNRVAAVDGDTQARGGRALCGGTIETRHCSYCKKVGHLKPKYLKIKAKQDAEEAKNATSGGAAKIDEVKDGVNNHAHTILSDGFRYFNTGAEDHFLFYQVTELEKLSNLHPSWLLLDSKSTIYIIANKAMVSRIKKSDSLITLHYNAGSRQVKYTAKLIGHGRVWYNPVEITNILSLYRATRRYQVVFGS